MPISLTTEEVKYLKELVAAGERVTLETLAAGTILPSTKCDGGEEIFLLTGTLTDDYGQYAPGTWIRIPAGWGSKFGSHEGAVFWVKRGHLQLSFCIENGPGDRRHRSLYREI